MDISEMQELIFMFNEVDNLFGDAAAEMFLGKIKRDRSGCGCAIVMMLVIFAIVIYFFIENS